MNIRKLIARQPLSPLGLIAVASGLLIALILVTFFLSWRHDRQAAAEAKVSNTYGTARSRSAIEAAVIADAARDAATAAANISQENEHDLRQAPGADARLDPRLNAAGRRGLCRYSAYRDAPECVQRPGPAQP